MERGVVRESGAVDSLCFEAAVEPDVGGVYVGMRVNDMFDRGRKGEEYALMPNQAKNPPTVDKLTNQLNTVLAPFEMVKKANHGNALAASTAVNGRPFLVVYEKSLGACPLSANPYRIREAVNKKLLLALNADVKTPALII